MRTSRNITVVTRVATLLVFAIGALPRATTYVHDHADAGRAHVHAWDGARADDIRQLIDDARGDVHEHPHAHPHEHGGELRRERITTSGVAARCRRRGGRRAAAAPFAFANALRHARPAMRRHRIVRRSIERVLLSSHPCPVFVLGNQKSGTTAIAALLSVATALPATLDFFHTLPERVLVDLLEGRSTLATLVRREPRPFARPIVKEPQLTFLAAALVEAFPGSRFAFVLRDPRDNIRSILNRVGIAGTAQSLGAQDRARLGRKPGWLGILDGHVFGCPGRSLVETLALRWNLAVGALAELPAHTARLRYEDFEADKQGRIEALAEAVGLEATHSIAARMNERFQPSGDRSLSWPEFFGVENLGLIEATCAAGMRAHGYRPTV